MKSKKTALILTFVGGWFGLHKFYYGEIRKGLLYALFSWTFIPFILAMIHLIQLLKTSDNKFQDKRSTSVSVQEPSEFKKPENLGDVVSGMKDIWKDPAARRKILKKTFFKFLS
jgi:TM2 domain-containing membrane protein YozV